jgi:nucleoside 2-deoxyribosyltransferase
MVPKSLYIIGSLRNPDVPNFANQIEALGLGIEAFADWFAPGPEADDYWRLYEKARNRSYDEALRGWAAKHVFEFDHFHLNRCEGAVMLMPAGKSCHLELGYTIGQGKPGYIVFDKEPERWDVMVQFAKPFFSKEAFFRYLRGIQ